jgi:hypothetical protein
MTTSVKFVVRIAGALAVEDFVVTAGNRSGVYACPA